MCWSTEVCNIIPILLTPRLLDLFLSFFQEGGMIRNIRCSNAFMSLPMKLSINNSIITILHECLPYHKACY